MATHDYIISNASGAAVRADLNNALAAIASNNSSATEPTTTYAYQWWADTGSSPTVMKLRNSANSAWITLFQLDGEWSLIPFENGTAAAPSIYFKDSGTDTGIFSPGADQVGISAGGTSRFEISTSATTSTLPVVHPLGAVATPSITFTGDLNTGIWSPAADTIAFSEGGTEAMRIDSSGRLGIGSTAPTNSLEVAGTATSNLFAVKASSSGDCLGITARSAGNGAIVSALNSAQSDYEPLEINGELIYFQTRTGAGTVSERARIDSSGRLLVGTSSARSNLFNSTFAPRLQIEGTDYSSSMASLICNSAGENAWLIFGRSKGTTIGSNTLPSADDLLGAISFQGSDGTEFCESANIRACIDGTPGANDMPGRLVFSTTADGASSPTERARITAGGYFKASPNTVYNSATGPYHEFANNTTVDPAVIVRINNASFADYAFTVGCYRSANAGYSLAQFLSGDGSTNPFSDREFNLAGSGIGYCDGSWQGGGADYAEYFEWSDSNPNEEDRRGISVVLDGDKIREAVAGEDPIGVISGNPSVVGDAAWNKWSGKYLRDEFGTYIQEDYEVVNDEGETVVQQRRKLNPAYDPDVEYIPREQRPEWDCVGLMGKLRIRKGQVTGSRWIKMRDISDTVEEWLVR